MALTHTALSAYNTTYYGLNRPILGTQGIPVAPDACWWMNTEGASDRTDPIYPARRAYDGYMGWWAQPVTGSHADTTWYLSITTTTAPMTFDFIGIVNHNFGTLHAGGALTITLEVDDAAGFGTCHSIPITVTTSTSNSRIMQLTCTHLGDAVALRYAAVPYARLKITRGATSFVPRIGELFLGHRWQQKHTPRLPYDDASLHSLAEKTETMGGVISVSTFSTGRRHLSAAFREVDTTPINALYYWFLGTKYGTRPFIWIECPLSLPTYFHVMVLDDPDFDFPKQEFADRNLTIEATEQGPENCYLENGVY